MKKTPQRSTGRKKAQKSEIVPFQEEYYRDMFTFQLVPVSEKYLLRIAEEWVNYTLENEEILTKNSYLNKKRLLRGTVDRWMDRCPELKEAFGFVTQILAERREQGATKGKLSESWVKYSHVLYDNEYRDLETWRNSLKEKIAGAGSTNVVVEMKKFPETDVVPARTKEKE